MRKSGDYKYYIKYTEVAATRGQPWYKNQLTGTAAASGTATRTPVHLTTPEGTGGLASGHQITWSGEGDTFYGRVGPRPPA